MTHILFIHAWSNCDTAIYGQGVYITETRSSYIFLFLFNAIWLDIWYKYCAYACLFSCTWNAKMPSILIICSFLQESILKKFKTENVSQETAEVFEDETATSEETIEAGLKLLIKRYLNLTKFSEVLCLVRVLRTETWKVRRPESSWHRYYWFHTYVIYHIF